MTNEQTLPADAVRTRHPARRGGLYLATALFVVFSALPFYVMLITTFKTQADIFTPTANPFWLSGPPTLDNLRLLFEQTLFMQWLWNTLLVGVAVVLITLVLAVPEIGRAHV